MIAEYAVTGVGCVAMRAENMGAQGQFCSAMIAKFASWRVGVIAFGAVDLVTHLLYGRSTPSKIRILSKIVPSATPNKSPRTPDITKIF